MCTTHVLGGVTHQIFIGCWPQLFTDQIWNPLCSPQTTSWGGGNQGSSPANLPCDFGKVPSLWASVSLSVNSGPWARCPPSPFQKCWTIWDSEALLAPLPHRPLSWKQPNLGRKQETSSLLFQFTDMCWQIIIKDLNQDFQGNFAKLGANQNKGTCSLPGW